MRQRLPAPLALLCAALAVVASGCHSVPRHHAAAMQAECLPIPEEMPRELSKVALPTYTIEPPDILVIEAIHIVPRSPYALRTGDLITLSIPESQTQPGAPINGVYPIQPGGIVDLGPAYGGVKVSGLTIEKARAEIARYLLENHLQEATLSASLVEMSGTQQIAGQHLVGPDGMVTLGVYGSVPVVGLTLAEARQTIEQHLEQFLEDPEVSVDVFAYNSLVYYVITEGAGLGDGVTRFPITGNETVLDAIANINGLTQVSSKRIWIARAVPNCDEVQILPVDWSAIAGGGVASTNYQIMPGDRVFVAEDRLIAFDTSLAKLLAPMERAMGFTLLTTGTVTRLSGKVLRGGGNPGGAGGAGTGF